MLTQLNTLCNRVVRKATIQAVTNRQMLKLKYFFISVYLQLMVDGGDSSLFYYKDYFNVFLSSVS